MTVKYIHVKTLWERLQNFRLKFQNDIILPLQTNEWNITYLLSHILLVFKCIYISREKHILTIDVLIDNLMKIKKKEKHISYASKIKTEAYNKNWYITDNVVLVT